MLLFVCCYLLFVVGIICSWFPAVYPEYLIKADEEFKYKVWLVPFSPNDTPARVAKSVGIRYS